MDNTIVELFKEKNSKILVEKLLLDVNNNDDSLRLTIKTKIELIISVKFLKKINSILKNSEIDYDVKTLDEIGQELKKIIKENIDLVLNVRKKNIVDEITNNFSQITNLLKVIDNEKENLKPKLENLINKIVYSELQNKLFNIYIFKSPEQKEDVSLALEKFDSVLTASILDHLNDRNSSLKNMIRETYDKVAELNEKATEMNVELTSDKVMKKEAA